MEITVITLFPEVFEPILNSSILKRAQKKKLVKFKLINLRDFGVGTHKTVDDKPYGGGVGMILKADVLAKALKSVARQKPFTILMSAAGTTFTQKKAKELSGKKNLVIVCGHYEGVDQRFADKYAREEISIGEYVLTGGEVPAMAVIDAITRLIPKVLEKSEAVEIESFSNNLLEFPQYTRPEVFEGKKVPKVLLSGNHSMIAKWRREQALKRTRKLRPELLEEKLRLLKRV